MDIEKDRDPRLSINEGEVVEIDSCRVDRDLESSTLTAIVKDGAPFKLTPGDTVNLYSGEAVIFMGKAIDQDHVLDLMSTETDDELESYETI